MNEKIKKEIQKEVEREFPEDFALQQVHIARKLLSEEAKEKGIEFWKFIKMRVKEIKDATHSV
ncbi:MAG: hypothetical protein GXO78_03895 [Calditrichaeota bacterium]|nr:hypothetical protein [Calditrichota bacterium]